MKNSEELKEKYIRTRASVLEFAKEYAYAYNPYANLSGKIELFDYQKHLLKDFDKNQFSIVKQSRQVGIDIAVATYIAYFVLKNTDKEILVISDSNKSGENFLSKIKDIIVFEELDYSDDNKIFHIDNKNHLQLKNGSRITVTSPNICAGRGCSIDLLFINNFEYVPYIKEVWMAVGIALSATQGKAIFTSTPGYKKSFFHNFWTDATKKLNDFKPTNVNWKQNPYFDNEWYKKMCTILNNDKDAIAMELDGKFIDKKDKKKKTAINLRMELSKKEEILARMKLKNISSITDYIMELINKDLGKI